MSKCKNCAYIVCSTKIKSGMRRCLTIRVEYIGIYTEKCTHLKCLLINRVNRNYS